MLLYYCDPKRRPHQEGKRLSLFPISLDVLVPNASYVRHRQGWLIGNHPSSTEGSTFWGGGLIGRFGKALSSLPRSSLEANKSSQLLFAFLTFLNKKQPASYLCAFIVVCNLRSISGNAP